MSVADDEGRRRCGRKVVWRKGFDAYAVGEQLCRQAWRVRAAWQAQHRAVDRSAYGVPLAERGQDAVRDLTFGGVEPAEPMHQAQHGAVLQKRLHGELGDVRRLLSAFLDEVRGGSGDVAWHYGITELKARREQLTEAADQRGPVRGQCRKAGHSAQLRAQDRVTGQLDEVAAGNPMRPLRCGCPPAGGEDAAVRDLCVRADHDGPAAARWLVHPGPMRINRQRRRGGRQRSAHRRRAGLFDGHGGAGQPERRQHQPQPVLPAAGDYDLLVA
ncbi:hypothetical protein Rhe02_95900 [Rhizocola hellebori]|uniref:Uncharacterized protein n=1 Tax=Rhizocola hellebori TaxID=1392758 RepID=A0A8J3QII6_9ACTN|nr:hypothetical protein Rhe02_95900 [Rhizocola hellebori]